MKYILSIFIILIFFTSCQKKIEVDYNENNIKIYKQKKEIIEKKEVIEKYIEEINIENNVTLNKNDINSTIAILYSSNKIGKYAIKISNIATAYQFNNNDNFNLKFYDLVDESVSTINNKFKELSENNISKIMFFITPDNVFNLQELELIVNFDIYLPLINKSNNDLNLTNIVYGGINYKRQLKVLKDAANSHIIEIYDNTNKSKNLHNDLNKSKVTSYILSGKYPNYKRFIDKHKSLLDASIILNMNIIKNSIFLSQITAYDDLNVSQILSTQSTYSPLLFVLTQTNDTKNLILSSSIENVEDKLYDINKLLNNDVKYDWVNYSTILGFEYLKYKSNKLFNNIEIINSQIQYPIKLYKTKKNSFVPYIKELNVTINDNNISD